ncbi:MAG: hypothetical protein BWX54_02372 [Verrucomicrobia bacterium ADurb.Bin018]|nr:MAG: hypothetical protein BWX54_02372 [Verrucomicrobia bacterium ADurb.Bin018]
MMEMATTGAGNEMECSKMGRSSAQRVSPVRVWVNPTTATMSPVAATSRCSAWLACMRRMRPTRWRLPCVLFSTAWPERSVPE